MPTQEEILQHKDAGKHSGTAAETAAKHFGLGKFSKQIKEFVEKFVNKKQKASADAKAHATSGPAHGEPAPAATTTAPPPAAPQQPTAAA